MCQGGHTNHVKLIKGTWTLVSNISKGGWIPLLRLGRFRQAAGKERKGGKLCHGKKKQMYGNAR